MDLKRLEELERKIQYLLDRQDILDVISRNARGCDRQDVEMLSACYADESLDDHGLANQIPGKEFAEWANKAHTYGSIHSMHNVTTHLCEIDGDTAHAESYVMGAFFNTDGKTSRVLCGRYIDKLERIDGQWQIVIRRSTVEVGINADSSFMNSSYFRDMGFLQGLRNTDDLSYQRPLQTSDDPDGHRWPKSE